MLGGIPIGRVRYTPAADAVKRRDLPRFEVGANAGCFVKPLKAYANVLRYRVNVAMRRQVVTNRPLVAYIEPTLFCNLACPACPTGLKLDLRPSGPSSGRC